jgi:hypothetical protein
MGATRAPIILALRYRLADYSPISGTESGELPGPSAYNGRSSHWPRPHVSHWGVIGWRKFLGHCLRSPCRCRPVFAKNLTFTKSRVRDPACLEMYTVTKTAIGAVAPGSDKPNVSGPRISRLLQYLIESKQFRIHDNVEVEVEVEVEYLRASK